MAETQPVRGFRDLVVPESSRTAALEAHARATLGRYGFGEVRLPTLENAELFVKSTGENTDIVEKEMFRLSDQGGRSLALRPEGTPGAVRAYLDNNLRQLGGPAKLFYVGSMFRAERPQKGRYREFEQIGVETLGNPHPAADVESILALRALLDAAGLSGRTRLKLNNLGCLTQAECRPRYRSELVSFLEARKDSLCETCKGRLGKNPLRILDCKGDGPRLRPDLPPFKPCAACSGHVEQVATLLAVTGVDHVRDPHLVRGLDYYNRTVFEFAADGLGSQDALAGGGRYDGLVEQMGGPSTPAVGWALGVERLLIAAEAADPALAALSGHGAAAGVFVAVQGGAAAVTEGTRALEDLRRFGLPASGGLFASSLKAQMKEAGRQGARLCVIIGDAEAAKSPPTCQLKDMEGGSQAEVLLQDLRDAAGKRLSEEHPRA
ncbi:MAG: histidine--tRNA ligase [Elusimicrobia bacterium]|nr:histidine--tRNA ligase [Elusimicrobiota bacterium]